MRKICSNCKVEDTDVPPEALIALGVPEDEIGTFKVYKGKGCPKCNNTGYKGRLGAYQVMPITSEMKQLILEGGSAIDIERLSIEQGVDTLRMDAIKKMKLGITTFEEVFRETTNE